MRRFALVLLTVAASAACAPAMTAGAHAPRPFPTATVPAAAPAGPSGGSARASLSNAVLATAMGLTGVPYRLGGADPSGFDCSGFVQYVLRRHAVQMPRTVIEQFIVGETPPAIEPGDLVFFQTIGSKASHVGIAIDAHSFVHAPNSRGVVRVDRLDAPYWSDRFLGARRVF